jgi:NAD+ synthase (glutamine-hydrolysing)
VKIALAQINPTVGDFSGNIRKILEFSGRSAELGAELVMFPELAVCGYPPADLLEKRSFLERAEGAVREIQEWTGAAPGRPAVLCGSVMGAESPEGKSARNVAVLLQDGQVRAVQQKTLLPFYDVFDEQRYFESASEQKLTVLETATGESALAITICEDAWNDKGFWPRRLYAIDPVERLMEQWNERVEQQDDRYRQTRLFLGREAENQAGDAGGTGGTSRGRGGDGEPGGWER